MLILASTSISRKNLLINADIKFIQLSSRFDESSVKEKNIKDLALKLGDEWKLDLSEQTKTIQLDQLNSEIEKIIKGLQLGRVVIKHGE